MASVGAAASGGATQAQPGWVITDLGTLGGRQSESQSVAINRQGWIIGSTWLGWDANGYEVDMRGFLWRKGKMINLGTLGSDKSSGAIAINGHVQIVGWSGRSHWEGPLHGFLWDKGTMRNLAPAALASAATAMNERGQVIGWSRAKRANQHGFLWQHGKVTTLIAPGRGWHVWPEAIDDRGQIIGEFDNGAEQESRRERVFVWRHDRMTILAIGGPISEAVAINERGQIIANSFAGFDDVTEDPYPSRAVLWENGRAIRLAPPDGKFKYSHAVAINDRGQIVGTNSSYFDASDGSRSFLWQKGKMTDLGTLPGYRATLVHDINERGQVVGESYLRYANYAWRKPHAFIWENGKMTALDTLPGGKECGAVGLNESSQIVGWCAITTKGEYPDRHAVLWTLKR